MVLTFISCSETDHSQYQSDVLKRCKMMSPFYPLNAIRVKNVGTGRPDMGGAYLLININVMNLELFSKII